VISFLLCRQDIAKEDFLDLLWLNFWHALHGSYIFQLGLMNGNRRTIIDIYL
jgi:hypothetical protein